MIDFEFTEEQKLFKKDVEVFIKNEVEPLVNEYEDKETFPIELFPKLGKKRLLGISFPLEYGGAGADKVSANIFVEELGHACSGIAMGVDAHVGLGCVPIWKYGTEAQRQKYLLAALAGEKIGAFALTEPEGGSDVSGIQSEAIKKGDKYILNGKKTWIGNGPIADFIIVAAYTDKNKKAVGISLFIIEKDFRGFRVSKTMKKVGHKASDHGELEFTDCEVPAKNILGEKEGGFVELMKTLVGARITHAAKSVGLARAAFEYALQYSKDRKVFGKSASEFQDLSFKLADMATKIESARLISNKAAWLYDKNKDCVMEASMAKLYASQVVKWVATEAVDILGEDGYSMEYPVERYYRDALVASITEGTSEIQRIIIGKELEL